MLEASAKRRIVIVGGGFAGAELARRLKRLLAKTAGGEGWKVILFSRENHFVFTPLLAEVVGSSISPTHVVWPVREMAPDAECRTVPILELDLETREVVYRAPAGEIVREPYDHLVIACGLATRLDLIPGMADYGWAMKTLGDAIALRNHVLQQLELAEAEPDPERRAAFLSFAVVGGGFTGIELAGSIMDLLVESCRFYQHFTRADLRVSVVDGGPRILGPLPEPLSAYADAALRDRGVEIRSGVAVKEVNAEGILVGEGELVRAATVVSAVGNTIEPLLAETPLPMERGRIVVEGTMQVTDREGVWALGDCAAVPNAYDGKISPTLGQFALRQAKTLAENLIAVIEGGSPKPFHYHMRGMFAAIGHGKAVGNPFGVRLRGFPAFMMWRGIYWAKMPSLTRRIEIAIDWFFDLLFARDIVEISTQRTPPRPPADDDARQE